jgi:hypothetical protein
MTNAAARFQSPFERFQVGDLVEHISLGPGVVTANDGRTITVSYNGSTQGVYNDAYFKSNPHSLVQK